MMEVKEVIASEMIGKGDGMAADGHVVSPGTENCNPNPIPILTANPNPSLNPNPSFNCNLNPVPSPSSSPSPSHNPICGPFNGPLIGSTHSAGGFGLKKKRGRPRKLGSDGYVGPTISPLAFSATVPIIGQISGWNQSRARCFDSFKKYHAYDEWDNGSGEKIAYSVGANFTPHVITINAGEDVTMKIMSFCQNGDRAICILSGNGTISNVTLRQPTSSGGTLTYEGRFEILSLSGSFMPTENGGTKSRSGGMSVSLAGPDGRVVGGGLAGLLVAAGPVQVVVGSFLPGHEQVQKQKNRARTEPPLVSPSGFSSVYPAGDEVNGAYGVKPILIPPPSFHGDIPASVNPISTVRGLPENSFLPQSEAKGCSPPNCDMSD